MTASKKTNKVVLDSSVWIELFLDGPLAADCKNTLETSSAIYVPTLTIYEVYKKIVLSASDDEGLSAVAFMSQFNVVDLTRDIALAASEISINNKLPMADSFVLAHSREENAVLMTLDNDFAGIENVRVMRKKE